MAGVFSVLNGCYGVEEQAIAHALNLLRGRKSGPGPGRASDDLTAHLEHEKEREEWHAHREASMAALVRRAMSAGWASALPGQDGGSARVGAEAGGSGGDAGGDKSTLAFRSRKLQVCVIITLHVHISKEK